MSTVQHNAGTTIRGGVTGRGFQPGQSGNPGGRPLGLARRVRELVGEDGAAIGDFMLSVMADEKARTADRMEAARWLADRGWGRAVQALDVEIEDHSASDFRRWAEEAVSGLSPEDFKTFSAILTKSQTQGAERESLRDPRR